MAFKSFLGIQVDRPAQNVGIVGTPGLPIYTIAGGLVMITGIIAVCTTTFGGGANTLSLELNPTAATGANSVLSLAADLGSATVVGDLITLVGAPGTALLGGHVAVNVLGSTLGKGLIVNNGEIGLVATAAAGALRWILWYIPIDAGATVVIA